MCSIVFTAILHFIMPSRNVIKIDLPETFYHVYARGSGRLTIFKDNDDYTFFIKLFERYLSPKQHYDKVGAPYPHLYRQIELLCYCLMPNHFHLLFYQNVSGSMTTLIRSLLTSYSRYFNKKYDRSGPLFESRYKASMINNEAYLAHISRYIHVNRKDWQTTPYSSINFYTGRQRADWVKPERILQLFKNPQDYKEFVTDYEDYKRVLDNIKYELANTTTPYF